MRVRKKPDLRIIIPPSPDDYVEMPASTKRLILEANKIDNDLKYVDDDVAEVGTPLQADSPIVFRVKNSESIRPRTPEIKITEYVEPGEKFANQSKDDENPAKRVRIIFIVNSESNIDTTQIFVCFEVDQTVCFLIKW
ncbi:hypothetical protein EVAR_8560_1 [Eumeta japonica]|uniref:Uncharacterized protein n=1 Tax=Eumeta variegata TaxID=151549 RepID=A0A4C1TXF1_EUMVA|nr:hypothetical protein EVAR_8560_1 [Eumeta japonica]